MNAQGELFATPFHERAYAHHSTLSGGEPVAAAGELIVENGRVLGITNQSGHYQPDAKMTERAITALREKGIDVKGVTVSIRSPDGFSDEKRTLQ